MLFRMIQPLSQQSIKDSVVTGGDSQSTFLLVIHTKAQKELMNKYGNNITLMDGIYRTTKYGFPCIFLTVKTSIGNGMVVATIIPKYENEDLLVEGLTILKQWNALWSPKFTMTDKSAVELGAIGQLLLGSSVTFTEVKHGRDGYLRMLMTSTHKTEVTFWSN